MDKQRKKELLAQFKKQEEEKFLKGLNTDIKNIHQLLDHLDQYLEETPCDHTLVETTMHLNKYNIDVDSTLDWLRHNGGYCDCEVLANLDDQIEGL